ncbi:MAG: hypothetical protein GH145_00550 [Firmicutes bacterium]|nr:hypothetical protein [Bacillota bacterium]
MLRNKKGLTLVGLVVVFIVILAIGFGIYKIFFATKSLKIKDLEDMYIVTTRSPAESAWDIIACSPFSDIGEQDYFGLVRDNSNEYRDGNPAKRLARVRLAISQDWSGLEEEKVAIQAGDRVELTYDGGRRLLVYLPRITQEDLTLLFDAVYELTLYVAPDGSTYYDEKLTRLAQSAP